MPPATSAWIRPAVTDDAGSIELNGNSKLGSASAEGDDAADGIVGRDANRYAIPGNHLDPEAAHPAAQLREHFVALVTLHAIQTAAVNGHDRTLHIDQIILAQML